ncbi:hypothetical protein Ancab_036438, partial [Ancistrocladus abbreviatus]
KNQDPSRNSRTCCDKLHPKQHITNHPLVGIQREFSAVNLQTSPSTATKHSDQSKNATADLDFPIRTRPEPYPTGRNCCCLKNRTKGFIRQHSVKQQEQQIKTPQEHPIEEARVSFTWPKINLALLCNDLRCNDPEL